MMRSGALLAATIVLGTAELHAQCPDGSAPPTALTRGRLG